jgi:hypothetical protein
MLYPVYLAIGDYQTAAALNGLTRLLLPFPSHNPYN